MHELARSWFTLVEVLVDVALRRARSEPVAELAAASETAVAEMVRNSERSPLPSGLLTRLGLSPRELVSAWTAIAQQFVPKIAANIDALCGGPDLTLGGLASIAYGGASRAIEELSTHGTLFRFGLMELDDGSGRGAWSRRCARATESLLRLAIAEEAVMDPAVLGLVPPNSTSPPATLAISDSAVLELHRGVATDHVVVILCGSPWMGRCTLMLRVATQQGVTPLEIDARRFSKDPVQLGKQLRAIARECRLLARVPLIANLDALEGERLEMVGSELMPLIEGRVLATCGVQRPAVRWDRPTIVVEIGEPTSAQRARLWCEALGGVAESDGERLATQYPLAPALIVRAAEAAKARAGTRELVAADVYAGIQAVLEDRLGQYARRVTVSQSWEDLVLPEEQMNAVVELIARVRERRRVYEEWGFAAKVGRGLGVSALFSGPPGTGKTMVAALIARDLGLELYQVDAARVVSKWIGESEKNLAAIFDAAEAGHAIVLFDEADALFGKRTEVRSSNDRYANLETNYLLQRLESFRGICLLTSNHESSIDPAFLRRLSLHLRFDVPDVEDRVRLWKAMLPEAAPVAAELGLESLARRYAMSGGYIRNAALRAAFLAADEGSPITAVHLERAARVEYEGMGKIAA